MDVIPRWADRYRGVPFVENGYTREGLNCWGLCWLVYKEQLGLELPKYPLGAHEAKSVARQMDDGRAQWISALPPARPFDLVLMRDLGRSIVRHIGVMVSASHCLHIEQETDAACVEISHPLIAPRIVSYHRHPSLA